MSVKTELVKRSLTSISDLLDLSQLMDVDPLDTLYSDRVQFILSAQAEADKEAWLKSEQALKKMKDKLVSLAGEEKIVDKFEEACFECSATEVRSAYKLGVRDGFLLALGILNSDRTKMQVRG